MTDSPVKRRRRRSRSNQSPPPRRPGDSALGEDIDVDAGAIAHVLANTFRRGGRTQRFLSHARHALTVSREIEALEGIAGEDRRCPALHALLMPARAVWLGDEEGEYPASAKAAARAKALGAAIDRSVREAAGLHPEPPEDWIEVSRFVALMTDWAEQGNTLVQGNTPARRDLDVGGARTPFPPLRRTIRPLAPEAAAERWLARFRDLAGLSSGGNVHAGSASVSAPATAAVEASQ